MIGVLEMKGWDEKSDFSGLGGFIEAREEGFEVLEGFCEDLRLEIEFWEEGFRVLGVWFVEKKG
jgi:hypothetical protein